MNYDNTTGYLIQTEFGVESVPFNRRQLIENQIYNIKINLANTDYQAIKYAEGQIDPVVYAPIKAQRQAWRDEINNLEKQLTQSE